MDESDLEEFKKDCPKYNYLPTILPAAERIIVIGDLHGDYDLTIESLKLAGVVDDKLNWTGGNTVVVQVGDQVDRCRPYEYKCDDERATINDEASDIKIMKLMTDLHEKAKNDATVNGAVYSLLGNHELMNSLGNLNYVSHKGLREFDDYKDPDDPSKIFTSGAEARAYAFAPGNEHAKFMACTRQSALIIGSFLFVHAGIIPEFTEKLNIKSKKDLVKVNKLVRKWLLGLINKDYVDQIVGSYKYSMFWDRILGGIPPNMNNNDSKCVKYLDPVLKLFNIGYMVIGHTPQSFSNQDNINVTCDNKLWRVDNGSSGAFHHFDDQFKKSGEMDKLRKAQILEILDDGKTINILK